MQFIMYGKQGFKSVKAETPVLHIDSAAYTHIAFLK